MKNIGRKINEGTGIINLQDYYDLRRDNNIPQGASLEYFAKTLTTDGNYTIETTYADIPVEVYNYDSTTLTSFTSDSFTGVNDSDPDINNWIIGKSTDGYPKIINNTLCMGTSDGNKGTAYIRSKFTLRGDFDIQVDYSNLHFLENTLGIRAVTVGTITPIQSVYMYQAGSGYFNFVYYNPSYNYVSQAIHNLSSGKMRLKRVGETFTGYFWTGSVWTQVGTISLHSFDIQIQIERPTYNETAGTSWLTYIDNVTLNSGTVQRCVGSTTFDDRMVIARYNGDLTISSNTILTTYVRKRGLCLYVDGDLIIQGKISMTDRGAANVPGDDINVARNIILPAVGGLGVEGVTVKTAGTGLNGKTPSINYVQGVPAGGGSGAVSKSTTAAAGNPISGRSGDATVYSGGTGSGAAVLHANSNDVSSLNSSSIGGTGGPANLNWYCSAGGGAGNLGGSGYTYDASGNVVDKRFGYNGTGGLIIIFAKNIINDGEISSNGSPGGSSNTAYSSGRNAAGGGSGAGGINIFYYNSFANNGLITLNGGSAGTGTYSGGVGGISAPRIRSLSDEIYIGDFHNLGLWLDSEDPLNNNKYSIPASNSAITTWYDKSGFKNNLVFTSGNLVYNVGNFNNKNSFYFSNDTSNTLNFGASPCTLFLVFQKRNTLGVQYQRVISSSNTGTDYLDNGLVITIDPLTTKPKTLTSLRYSEAKNLQKTRIGMSSTSTSYGYYGDIAEVVLFLRYLEDDEYNLILNFLKQKWGII